MIPQDGFLRLIAQDRVWLNLRVGFWGRRFCWVEVAVPTGLEGFQVVAFEYCLWAGAVIFGVDAEGFQQAGQVLGLHGFGFVPLVPLAVVQGVEKLKQVSGGDPFRVFFGCKGVAKVGKDLLGAKEVFKSGQSEGIDQGCTGTLGPFSADEVSDVQERFGTIALAEGEFGWELVIVIRGNGGKEFIVGSSPLAQGFPQRPD